MIFLMLLTSLAIGHCLNTIITDVYQYAKKSLILYKNANNCKYMEPGHEISM